MEWSVSASNCYVFTESRSAREIETQLSSSAGVLQVDGYRAYQTLAKRETGNSAPLRLAYSLALRKFVDVVKMTASLEAVSILARIAEIYRIKATVRGESADAWLMARRRDAAPIRACAQAQLAELSQEVSSKSALGNAVSYALNIGLAKRLSWTMDGSNWTPTLSSVQRNQRFDTQE